MPHITETFEEWLYRQGVREPDDQVKLENGLTLLPSGASFRPCRGRGEGLIEFREPPDRETEPLNHILALRRYARAKLEREVRRWQSAKKALADQALKSATMPHSCPPPPAEAVEGLRAGRERVNTLRQQLALVEAEVADFPELRSRAAAYQHALERDNEARAAGERLLAEIQGVNLQGGPQP